jgi:DNA ligase-1
MKAPNEQLSVENLPYGLIASIKIDGIRCVFKDGQMLSCSLKEFANATLKKTFSHLAEESQQRNIILDGELYSPSLTFNDLSGLIRRLDSQIPEDLAFYCFDSIQQGYFQEPYRSRLCTLSNVSQLKKLKIVPYRKVDTEEETIKFYEEVLEMGFEGLILRTPDSKYKLGRATLKEKLIFKLKPYVTFDAKVIDVLEGTEAKANAEKTINELGYSRTSKKKDDRILCGKAKAFVVLYNNLPLKVSLAMTDADKKKVWENKEQYIGKIIEYKGLLVGAKNLPRHAEFIRYRPDKENE